MISIFYVYIISTAKIQIIFQTTMKNRGYLQYINIQIYYIPNILIYYHFNILFYFFSNVLLVN